MNCACFFCRSSICLPSDCWTTPLASFTSCLVRSTTACSCSAAAVASLLVSICALSSAFCAENSARSLSHCSMCCRCRVRAWSSCTETSSSCTRSARFRCSRSSNSLSMLLRTSSMCFSCCWMLSPDCLSSPSRCLWRSVELCAVLWSPTMWAWICSPMRLSSLSRSSMASRLWAWASSRFLRTALYVCKSSEDAATRRLCLSSAESGLCSWASNCLISWRRYSARRARSFRSA
mmetsp:Transcript_43425/g.114832  ORF Transcript_43425/g.114832 Transcript_43425/m.114832 type:complete len:234 (+) Transcript_43425:280-981(+)